MSKYHRDVHKDIRLSALLGPLKFVIPVIGYVLLYPIIIDRYGYEVLGLWSLLSAIPYALSTLDVGFSQHIAREANRDADRERVLELYHHYVIAKKFYFCIVLLLLAVFLLFAVFYSFSELPYSRSGFAAAMILMILAVLLELLAKLEASVLQAGNDTYYTQIINGASPAILFLFAFLGAWNGYPLELLSLGYLLSFLTALIVFRRRVSARQSRWMDAAGIGEHRFDLRELLALLKSGVFLYGTSIGMLIRDPILRFTVATVLGLEAAAVYEIAMRVGRTARELVATGFLSLYPSFALLLKQGQTKTIELIARRTLVLLLIAGWGGLSTVAVLSPWIYEIWLGHFTEDLVAATQVVCVWCGVTLFSVPFWHLIMAGHKEKLAAAAVWIHALSSALVFPLSRFVSLSLVEILLLWTVVAVFTHISVYLVVERYFGLFISVVRKKEVVLALKMPVTHQA